MSTLPRPTYVLSGRCGIDPPKEEFSFSLASTLRLELIGQLQNTNPAAGRSPLAFKDTFYRVGVGGGGAGHGIRTSDVFTLSLFIVNMDLQLRKYKSCWCRQCEYFVTPVTSLESP